MHKLVTLVLALAVALPAGAATLAPGDILYANTFASGGELVRIDSFTGEQTVVASGGVLDDVSGVAVASGDVAYLSVRTTSESSVVKIDLASGDRTAIASDPSWGLRDLIPDPGGDLILLDTSNPDSVIRLSLSTGVTQEIPVGGSFVTPWRIATDPHGELFVTDFGATGVSGANDGLVLSVDPLSGSQTVLSSGGGLFNSKGIGVEADGRLVVADAEPVGGFTPGRIWRIDPATGEQTLVSELRAPNHLRIEADGSILVSELTGVPLTGRLVRIDPVTGSSEILSEGGSLVGSGSFDLAPVPEPSSLVLLPLGLLLAGSRLRRSPEPVGSWRSQGRL